MGKTDTNIDVQKMRKSKDRNDEMLTRLFYKLLPVQILIAAMGAVNSIVDGVIAGRCIDASTVGVVGLYFSFVSVLNAIASMLLGGTSVLCGRSMGRGDLNKTNRIFSLNISVTLIIGAVLTLMSYVIPGAMADILGANAELKAPLITYIRGYAVGLIPLLLAQQVAAFLQMERQDTRGMVGVLCMIVSNIVLDILLVAVLHLGVAGLALATSLSNWIYLLVLLPYYFSGKAQLKYNRKNIDKKDLWPMLRIGFPGALLVFCLAIRGLVINRILLTYSGSDGLSAQAALSMVNGLFIAIALGTGAVLRILASVFFGEGDKDSLKKLLRIAFTRLVPQSLAVTVIILLLATPLSLLFFPDRTSEVFELTHQLFIIYSFCVPLIVLCQIETNYLQAGGHNIYVNVLSVFDGFFAMVIPAVLLAPHFGATGVWLANPIGIILTLLCTVVYTFIFWRRKPKNDYEWMLLRPDFGVPDKDRLDITICSMKDVVNTAAKVQKFCEEHGMNHRISMFSALCLEEMAANVVEHGFNKDNKNHTVDARVVYENGGLMLRLKDDCVPYDPGERAGLIDPEDPTRNIGLRMVMGLSKDMSYNNLMGLNVLTIIM